MKVPGSINRLFQAYEENAKATKAQYDDWLNRWCKENNWFFVSRIKKLSSFAQKLETGRFKKNKIDDAYACTIVVRTRSEIEECISRLLDDFDFRFSHQIPEDIHVSNISPHNFHFDSVRLYFKPALADVGSNSHEEQLFEIQVQTLIEQAWSIATHDFQYKSDSCSWARSRVSSQIKALLDSAELAIVEAESLVKSPVVQKQDRLLDRLHEIISYFRTGWDQEKLPKDLKRLAENVENLLKPIEKDVDWLKKIIEEETEAGRGRNSLNLSPYWIVFQSIVNVEGKSFFDKVKKYKIRGRNIELSIIDEITIPDDVNIEEYSRFNKI